MFQLAKGEATTIPLTCFEDTTISDAFYLMELENQQTKVKFYLIITNINTEVERCEKFVITETASPDALNGEVELDAGKYFFRVYEQDNGTNLDPEGLDIVERGECYVTNDGEGGNTYYTPTLTNTFYNG